MLETPKTEVVREVFDELLIDNKEGRKESQQLRCVLKYFHEAMQAPEHLTCMSYPMYPLSRCQEPLLNR